MKRYNSYKSIYLIWPILFCLIALGGCFTGKKVENFNYIKKHIDTLSIIPAFVDIRSLDKHGHLNPEIEPGIEVGNKIQTKIAFLLEKKYTVDQSNQIILLDSLDIFEIIALFKDLEKLHQKITKIDLPDNFRLKIQANNSRYLVFNFYNGFYKTADRIKMEERRLLLTNLVIGFFSYGMGHPFYLVDTSADAGSEMRTIIYDSQDNQIIFYFSSKGTNPAGEDNIKAHVLKNFNPLYYGRL